MKFGFSKEDREEIEGFFDEEIEKISEAAKALFNGLQGIYENERYKPLYTMTSIVHTYYGEDFRKAILGVFDDWAQNSGSNLKAFSEELEASDGEDDDSYQEARNTEADMRDILESLFDGTGRVPIIEEPTNTIVSLTRDIEDIFAEIDTMIQKFNDNIDSLESDCEAKVNDKVGDNQLYQNVGAVLSAVFGAYKSLGEEVKKEMEKMGSNIGEQGKSAVSKAEADKETMKSDAEKAAEGLKDAMGLFDFT